jgi:hypothetical protein
MKTPIENLLGIDLSAFRAIEESMRTFKSIVAATNAESAAMRAVQRQFAEIASMTVGPHLEFARMLKNITPPVPVLPRFDFEAILKPPELPDLSFLYRHVEPLMPANDMQFEESGYLDDPKPERRIGFTQKH